MPSQPRRSTLQPRRPVAKQQQPYPRNTPTAIARALRRRGMDGTPMLGPGAPIRPVTGYSQPPRVMDYPTGVNISTVSRSAWARTSFDTIKAIIDAYDVARMCINHKIDELKSMEPLFNPADGYSGDTDGAVDAAKAALAFPDRESPFDEWLSKLLENALRYDACPLYHRRNMGGDIIGLEVVDGPTIAPYIDENGRRPKPPAPAFYQLVHGQIWDWFTSDDIVYRRFRPQTDSPYGLAPIESVLLTVNTDIRFQWHFLQMFTEGSVPAGFIELPPDVSSPDQVAEWQDYWDAMVLGDEAKLHQLIAVPNGTTVNETRPKTFDKTFPQYLMMRTCAAFGVVPQDLGFVDDVNRANGETQVDVQFRVNTLPWVRWVEGICTRYLQRGLGLPVKVNLDTGRDKEDRLADAQAWEVYINSGMASADEGRQELLGLPIDNDRPVPRFIMTKAGPVPLQQFLAIAGKVDAETGAPVDDVPLSTAPFAGVHGVIPDKQPGATQFQRAPVDPDEPDFPQLEHPIPGSDVVGTKPGAPVIGQPGAVAKEATAGVTVETGLTGHDLIGQDDDDEDDDDPHLHIEKELAAFARFRKARARAGRWRDFTFAHVDPVAAHRLNDQGRAQVRKDAGELIAAGLAVQAVDTGRVLMLQRALDPDDPAAGMWEFPGGHIEDGETPLQAAKREWQEETGCLLPDGDVTGQWTSGIYQGFVYTIPSENQVPILDRGAVVNPDDPDGDVVEALAWWAPEALGGVLRDGGRWANPVVRAELRASLPVVQDSVAAALDAAIAGLDSQVAKAGGGSGPKA